ncbi:hypothetical protein EYZ11_009314 [Aspergillus tanneri]|uniref:Uncharacterized protein n=1 Tax=Aspergillus tanneri TaxID=1220188 RepID=A0A4V3UNI3_9EURO|nr:hypothetical protein EYZ11_009314 [Aspergillus tanneri]
MGSSYCRGTIVSTL